MTTPKDERLARRNAAVATKEGTALYMRYLGVLRVLGQCGAHLHAGSDLSEEAREEIEMALQDAADNYPVTVRKVGGLYIVEPDGA